MKYLFTSRALGSCIIFSVGDSLFKNFSNIKSRAWMVQRTCLIFSHEASCAIFFLSRFCCAEKLLKPPAPPLKNNGSSLSFWDYIKADLICKPIDGRKNSPQQNRFAFEIAADWLRNQYLRPDWFKCSRCPSK